MFIILERKCGLIKKSCKLRRPHEVAYPKISSKKKLKPTDISVEDFRLQLVDRRVPDQRNSRRAQCSVGGISVVFARRRDHIKHGPLRTSVRFPSDLAYRDFGKIFVRFVCRNMSK